MIRRSVVLAFMLLAAPASADVYLSNHRLFNTIAGKTFEWPDKSSSTYERDGTYIFQGVTRLDGSWRVVGDKVCVTFSSGLSRCDRYEYRNDVLFLQDASGKRFRARAVPEKSS